MKNANIVRLNNDGALGLAPGVAGPGAVIVTRGCQGSQFNQING